MSKKESRGGIWPYLAKLKSQLPMSLLAENSTKTIFFAPLYVLFGSIQGFLPFLVFSSLTHRHLLLELMVRNWEEF